MFKKLFVILGIIFGLSTIGFSQEMKKDEMMKDSMKKDEMAKEDTRPIVAVFRADWCPYCKKLEPIMKDLMMEYDEKLNFVVFDVTNEKTISTSMEIAKENGLQDFFKENKGKSAFVVIFKDKKQVFKAKYDTEKETYIKAFEKVLE